jgi:hypothetical protein
VRSYKRTLAEFGAADPDANFQLASILIRLGRRDDYGLLTKRILPLGPPGILALYEVLEQLSDRDEKKAVIVNQARQLLWQVLLERQLRSRARVRAVAGAAQQREEASREATEAESPEPGLGEDTMGTFDVDFVPLSRELGETNHFQDDQRCNKSQQSDRRPLDEGLPSPEDLHSGGPE